MADIANKYAENVSGKFYVDDQCIDCDLCRETAPANFTRSDDGGYSYVFKQPTTPEEEALCKEAMEGCPVEAIGNNGEGWVWSNQTDSSIMAKLLKIAKTKDVPPGQAAAFTIEARKIALFNVEGTYHAIGDTCTMNISKNGARESVGLPGSGISYRTKRVGVSRPHRSAEAPRQSVTPAHFLAFIAAGYNRPLGSGAPALKWPRADALKSVLLTETQPPVSQGLRTKTLSI
jgi:ferredoxin